jgi:DNA-binding XRE family transcriptional regulator
MAKQTLPELADHPIAAMFPLLDEVALNDLAEAIARNGQREAIVLYQGQILDGRNRFRACSLAGVKPITRNFDPTVDGKSVLQFVLDHNLNRRHLTASQRSMIMAMSLKAMQSEAAATASKTTTPNPATPPADPAGAAPIKETVKKFGDGTIVDDETTAPPAAPTPPAMTQQEAANAAGVSLRTMNAAEKVLKEDPTGETAKDIASGKKTISQAQKEKNDAQEAADKKALEEERKAFLKELREAGGDSFKQAFLDGDVLKTTKEAAAFRALDVETRKKVVPLVATGWKVGRAAAHVNRAITGATTLDDLINRAIAEGGALVHSFSGWEIAITKIEK